MPQLAAVFSIFSVGCCSSSSLPPRRSVSSANRKLQSSRPPMDTEDSDVSTSSASSYELSQIGHSLIAAEMFLKKNYIK